MRSRFLFGDLHHSLGGFVIFYSQFKLTDSMYLRGFDIAQSMERMAIWFESDGKYRFEYGESNHVQIAGNVFESCKFAEGRGKYIITFKPREECIEGQYYHKYIRQLRKRPSRMRKELP